jgi:transposase
MADISRIVDLYDLYKSYRRVARELKISRNTVKKYVLRVKEVQDGLADEILPKNRGIIQPSRVLTEPVRQKIHEHLESNLSRPKKQRITAKRIWELLIEEGHRIGYSSVKNEVAHWKRTNAPREVFILQEPRVGQRAEFDLGEVTLSIAGFPTKKRFEDLIMNDLPQDGREAIPALKALEFLKERRNIILIGNRCSNPGL